MPSLTLPKKSLIAHFSEPGKPFGLRDQPIPELRAGEALLRVDCCTLCASDLRTVRGERTAPASGLLGHEISGRIVATDESSALTDVAGKPLTQNARVICGVAASCGNCRYCQRGIPQKCEHLRKFGHASADSNWQLSGGLAEYCHLPMGSSLVQIPDTISARESAWLGCAGATAAAAIRTAGELDERSVLVTGAGAVGLFVAAMARQAGAEVFITDLDVGRLKMAGELGAIGCQLDREAPESKRVASARDFVMDHTDGRGADVIMETTGVLEAVRWGIAATDIGAKVIFVGSVAPSAPVSVYPEQVVKRLLRIEGIHNYTPIDLQAAVDFVSGHDTLLRTIGGDFPALPLRSINEAIDLAKTGQHLRVAVEPTL
ncbi:MAG: putative phosphonate catabolism associated alcohol dehydrogenase [Limisphaerales bacterium]